MENNGETKKCLHCQTDIPLKAKKCPHCQSDLRSFWARHIIFTGFLLMILLVIFMGMISDLISGFSTSTTNNQPQTKVKTQLSPELTQKSKEALASMKKDRDDIGQVTFYLDPSSPLSHNTNNVEVYISKPDDESAILRFAVSYAGEEWLFINKYIFNIDGKNVEVNPYKVERDNSNTIWEWSDDPITTDWSALAFAIAHSKVAKIRYVGTKYYDDRVITETEKKAINNVLNAYLVVK